jgi:hypothetical protein
MGPHGSCTEAPVRTGLKQLAGMVSARVAWHPAFVAKTTAEQELCRPSFRQARCVSGILASWNEGAPRRALVEFVERTVSDAVPVEERVAVFDNDGALWCEKPTPIQLDFILRRLVEMERPIPNCVVVSPGRRRMTASFPGWAPSSAATTAVRCRTSSTRAGSCSTPSRSCDRADAPTPGRPRRGGGPVS